MAAGAADQNFQATRLYGLLQEPIGAQFVHSLDGGLDVAVGGEHDSGRHFARIA